MSDLPPGIHLGAFVCLGAIVWVACSFFVDSFRQRVSLRVRLLILIPVLLLVSGFAVKLRFEIVKANARTQVRDKIQSITVTDYTTTVNGKKVSAPNLVVDSLLKMQAKDANHSGPRRATELSVRIAAGDQSITLALVQDRRYEDQFRVFWTGYSASRRSQRAISRITSPQLRDLLTDG